MQTALVHLLAVLALVPTLAFAQAADVEAQALATYQQGKTAYDARNFAQALGHFDDAAALEPGRARWQYNRGLALRKLDRSAEAIEALLKSRALDPEYKRAEIDEKLQSLGHGAAAGGSGKSTNENSAFVYLFVLVAVFAAAAKAFHVVLKSFLSKPSGGATPSLLGARRAALPQAEADALQQSIGQRAQGLSHLEHGLSLGEDAEARAAVDRAASNLEQSRMALAAALSGAQTQADVAAPLARCDEAMGQAETRLRTLHGPALDAARGEAVGCFCCARPLPTPASRHPASMTVRGAAVTVTLCARCARLAAAGTPPRTLMARGQGGWQHWSQAPGFDPYLHAHLPPAGMEARALGDLKADGAQLGALALAAGAGAVAAGMLGAAAALDLDAAQAAAASAVASVAAAQRASSRQSSRWTDNS